MLIDTHCHLDFPISTSVARYETYRGIAERFDNVWFTVGTHPHRAHEEPDIATARLVELAQHPRCVAIGEAGLDYLPPARRGGARNRPAPRHPFARR
jgi:TatD DNase family protein